MMQGETQVKLPDQERVLFLERELVRLREGISHIANHDPLTGCWNRHGILDMLRREMARVRRDHSHFGVIMLAVDQFKSLNAEHGELAGDAALRAVVRRIHPSVRPYDSIGRYQDNVFLIVAPGCELPNAVTMAERIRSLIAKEGTDVSQDFTPHDYDDPYAENRLPLTLSLGVFASDEIKDPEILFGVARAALDKAKLEGGNRVMVGVAPENGGPTGSEDALDQRETKRNLLVRGHRLV